MITYTYGAYDILRAKDLQQLDKQIQQSRRKRLNCIWFRHL